jgi:predicted Rossmann fold nucleotide-binding protein DprA/Smf involved in DNA uptake
VLETFGIEAAAAPPPDVSDEARRVLAALQEAPASADELARRLGIAAGAAAGALAELELAGLLADSAGLYRAHTRPPLR